MTRVLFDTTSGRLRLDPPSFDTLLSWAQGDDHIESDGFRALTDAGVIIGDQPHPTIAPALDAIADPICLLTLHATASDDMNSAHGAGWMGEETAALALDAPDDLVELVGLSPMLIPAVLARVVDLSPRPSPHTDELLLPTAAVEELFSPNFQPPIQSESASSSAATLTTTGTRRWELSVRWLTPAGTTHTSNLRVVDTPGGLWTVANNHHDYATLQPATPTTVWRRLLRQFPP